VRLCVNGSRPYPRRLPNIKAALIVSVLLTVVLGYWLVERTDFGQRSNVLAVVGAKPVTVMAFSAAFSLSALPAGWYHRRFVSRAAMDVRAVQRNGGFVAQCQTHNSASMLVRYIDADIAQHPFFEWRWMVEDGIESPLDERSKEGDDHPIRLFLRFADAGGATRAMEVIWANVHLQAGEWKYLGRFPHFVANGGVANLGRWHDERVDLRDLYRSAWGGARGIRLTEVALFCDSDETGDATSAYVQYVRLEPNGF
jgi:hypothetical protein